VRDVWAVELTLAMSLNVTRAILSSEIDKFNMNHQVRLLL
jgi:hypothetical protein